MWHYRHAAKRVLHLLTGRERRRVKLNEMRCANGSNFVRSDELLNDADDRKHDQSNGAGKSEDE